MIPRALWRILLFAFFGLLPIVVRADEPDLGLPADIPSLPVHEVSFRTAESLTYDDLAAPLPLKPGEILTREKLRESIQALYLRGIFDHVDARITARPSDVDVEFLLTPTYFVYDVMFSGNVALDDKPLRRLAGIRLGEPLSLAKLIEAKERIIAGYRREGYFFTEIHATIEKRAFAPQVIIHMALDEGPQSKISRFELTGDLPPELVPLREESERRVKGAAASESNMKTLRQELLRAARNEGYLQASVELSDPELDRSTGEVTLQAHIEPHGPQSIVFAGNTHFDAEELLKPLKLDTRTVPFTPSAIGTLCREIEKMYQQDGYFFAEATSDELPPDGARRLYRVSIKEGPLIRLEQIRFKGNKAFSAAKLLELMETKPASFSFLHRKNAGHLQKETLSSDLGELEAFYHERGYLDAKVNFELIPGDAKDTLELVITIEENERTDIESVDIQWKGLAKDLAPGPEQELLVIPVQVKIGDPFSRRAMQDEQQRLTDEIIRRGFPNVKVDLDIKREEKSVRFIIEPGKHIEIGRVWISGNTSVADYLIKRELKFSSGEPLEPDKLRDSEQNLYRLGYFKNVEITPTDGALDQDREDLSVRVSERDTGFVEVGTTLNTEDGLHIFSNLGQRNLGGEGKSIVLGIDGYIKSGSQILDAGNMRALYTQPHIFGSDWDWITEGFAQYSIELLDPYSFDRIGASTSFRSPESEDLKTSLGYSAFQERLYDVPDDAILGPDDIGSTVYSFLNYQLDYDKRDSTFNPRRGNRSLFQARYNSSWLGSSVDFYALFFQESVYLPLGTDFVWANNLRVNYLRGLDGTEVIPLSQRIFLGGRNTLRGFSLNVVGPRGEDGDIVGGDSSVNLNSELQYDITESFVGVLFIDIGQAFIDEKGNFTGDAPGFDDLRYSPGIGGRYKTPIGPISLELGVNPDRKNGERWGRLHLSVGGAF